VTRRCPSPPGVHEEDGMSISPSLLEGANITQEQLDDLAAKIQQFEASLSPAQKQLWDVGIHHVAPETAVHQLVGDANQRQALEVFLKAKAGTQPSGPEVGSISITVISVSVISHC